VIQPGVLVRALNLKERLSEWVLIYCNYRKS
jgi:hypothetical protein